MNSELSSLINSKLEKHVHRLWRWIIGPSPQITAPDLRRQATLLSTLLLGLIFITAIVETITVVTIEDETYTGYRQTIVLIGVLICLYAFSRSRHVRVAGVLTTISISLAGFILAAAWPGSIQGGLLDYLIIPIWLGSLFLRPYEMALVMIAELVGLLVLPWFLPVATLNDILIGPFSFILVTAILIILITRYRNLLEDDRKAELMEKEQRSRMEAARSQALLRVAERLNAQLDLDSLLTTISNEVTQALNTPVSIVALKDKQRKALFPVTGTGLSPDLIKNIPPISEELYEQLVKSLGTIFAVPDVQIIPSQPHREHFIRLNLTSMAFVPMKYEQDLIGSLVALTLGKSRNFTEDELLLLRGLADQAALAIVNTRLYKDARRRLEHLQALRAIDVAIASNLDLHKTFDVLLEQITRQLNVDAAVFLILNKESQRLEYGASLGFYNPTLRFTRLRVGEGMAGRAVQQRKVIRIDDLRIDPQTLAHSPTLARETFTSYYATPLISKEQVIGVLEIFHRSLLDPDQEWLEFLETLAGQAAIAIESTSLFADLQQMNEELVKAYDSTIEGWSHALDLRDKETEGHTLRVTELTLELARAFGFGEAELVQIRRGALLHDIGKMGIPDRILLKGGPLTQEEWEIMRKHPDYAHEMLLPIEYLRPALDIPYCHHEKWDGSGYPRGLAREQIPLSARIFAVVDVWDALTSDRPYRPAWSQEKAIAHIQEQAGTHFDAHIVAVFLDLIQRNLREKA